MFTDNEIMLYDFNIIFSTAFTANLVVKLFLCSFLVKVLLLHSVSITAK